jgi:hypothetical protein
VTAYEPQAEFAWTLERSTFDGGSSVVITDRDGDVAKGFTISADGGFVGKGVVMQVDTGHIVMEIATEKAILPITGDRQTWLELHYRADIPFSLSLVGTNDPGLEQFFSAYEFYTTNDAWNKIYINLTEILVQSKLEKHGLYFRAVLPKDGSGKYPQTKGTVRLDNIRILHY